MKITVLIGALLGSVIGGWLLGGGTAETIGGAVLGLFLGGMLSAGIFHGDPRAS